MGVRDERELVRRRVGSAGRARRVITSADPHIVRNPSIQWVLSDAGHRVVLTFFSLTLFPWTIKCCRYAKQLCEIWTFEYQKNNFRIQHAPLPIFMEKELGQWSIRSCFRTDYINADNAVVCSLHFTNTDYNDNRKSRLLDTNTLQKQQLKIKQLEMKNRKHSEWSFKIRCSWSKGNKQSNVFICWTSKPLQYHFQ